MDLIPQLDTRTLAFATGFAGLVMGLSMLGLYAAAGMRNRALIDWSIAGFGFGLGYQLGHVMLHLPMPWGTGVSLAISNTLIATGHVFVLLGAQRYLARQRRWTWVLLAVVLMAMALPTQWQMLEDSAGARVLVLAPAYVVLAVAAGMLFWRRAAPGLTPYRRVVALVLFVHAVFLTLRALHAAGSSGPLATFPQDSVQVVFFVVTMVFVFALTLSLALLVFREQEAELQWLVLHDPLTGLFNRRSLGEQAARELARCRREGMPLALVALDIDHFKRINDSRGHLAGDEVIRSVARQVAGALRGGDAAFRLGGEEFLLLLPCTDVEGAAMAAERLRATLASTPLEALDAPVTASFGVTAVASGEEWTAALRRADQALYRAKHEGRNRVVVLQPQDTQPEMACPVGSPA